MNTDAASQFDTVSVLGAGVIGVSWTAMYLAAGLRVKVLGIADYFEARVYTSARNTCPTPEQLGLTDSGDCRRASLHNCASDAVQDADFIQENVPECIESKLALYREIEPDLSPRSIVASFAPGLMLKELQCGWEDPSRLILGHPSGAKRSRLS